MGIAYFEMRGWVELVAGDNLELPLLDQTEFDCFSEVAPGLGLAHAGLRGDGRHRLEPWRDLIGDSLAGGGEDLEPLVGGFL